jgi:hypothetical protein
MRMSSGTLRDRKGSRKETIFLLKSDKSLKTTIRVDADYVSPSGMAERARLFSCM